MDILITFSGNAGYTEGLILTGQFFLSERGRIPEKVKQLQKEKQK